jgi:uncharacterized coiled-coil DUF342 family protein
MVLLDVHSRQIVRRVQELRDERDELLDILAVVADGYDGDRYETAVAVIPIALMDEIRRRVGRDQ